MVKFKQKPNLDKAFGTLQIIGEEELTDGETLLGRIKALLYSIDIIVGNEHNAPGHLYHLMRMIDDHLPSAEQLNYGLKGKPEICDQTN